MIICEQVYNDYENIVEWNHSWNIAYDNDKPIGWCSVAPRGPGVGKFDAKRIDDKPVWSIVFL
jgi:hypothetical protein